VPLAGTASDACNGSIFVDSSMEIEYFRAVELKVAVATLSEDLGIPFSLFERRQLDRRNSHSRPVAGHFFAL
jgi:hypothetical protein